MRIFRLLPLLLAGIAVALPVSTPQQNPNGTSKDKENLEKVLIAMGTGVAVTYTNKLAERLPKIKAKIKASLQEGVRTRAWTRWRDFPVIKQARQLSRWHHKQWTEEDKDICRKKMVMLQWTRYDPSVEGC